MSTTEISTSVNFRKIMFYLSVTMSIFVIIFFIIILVMFIKEVIIGKNLPDSWPGSLDDKPEEIVKHEEAFDKLLPIVIISFFGCFVFPIISAYFK